ncbi:hypothetical protein Ahy_A04g018591 [Arachis hypogaea]|uniref:Uncharacterized protein n=1 Tax=Arachis hypogaea TaxID=3818 RepID=A0A445DE02_ARAHY|nr:hypothetical protein Ahy_A04g018591 [Arachis hypogaea]
MLSTTDTRIRYYIWLIDSDGTIKSTKLSMREDTERPNGRKIVLKFNNAKQAIGDEAGLLSGVLGLLGSDYGKFSICRESWCQITIKDKIYNKYVKEKCRKNAINRSKQLYTHTGSSKSFSRQMEEEVFKKEKPGRVRAVGFRLTPSQFFGPNSHASGNRVQVEETQRKLLELQAELEGEKLKRKAMEDEAVAEKKKRQALESALIYLFQWQGEELPPNVTAGMSNLK